MVLHHSAARKKLNLVRVASGQTDVSEACGLRLTKTVDILPQRQAA